MEYEISDQPQEGYIPERHALNGEPPEGADLRRKQDHQPR